MNILMVTNTYTPVVGGVERSIRSYTQEYRKWGHKVLIVTLEFDNMPEDEVDIVRLPAIRRFNGSDFSIRMPIPFDLSRILEQFKPDIVHSHHPFILGDTALRIAKKYQIPLVFTHHTRYEDYTHYVPIELPAMRKFVIQLTSGYAELADHVFAPSKSIEERLLDQDVSTPVTVLPTGVDFEFFKKGDGEAFRKEHGISDSQRCLGHVGRLAKEKNLTFLTRCITNYLKSDEKALFVLVGKGPYYKEMEEAISSNGLEQQFIYTGVLEGQDLVDAYCAMDLFLFSSKSETQGMVLLEAMAASTPVVALSASGVDDVVRDGENGFLLQEEDPETFVDCIRQYFEFDPQEKERFQANARSIAQSLSIESTSQKALDVYSDLIKQRFEHGDIENTPWTKALGGIKAEWELLGNLAGSVGQTIRDGFAENESFFSRLRKWFDRREWSIKLLRLKRCQNTEAEPGLVLIQIDGLSSGNAEQAMARRKLPFLRKLMKREKYELRPMYSGLPSTTPAVQAELFYGIKGAVPSFSFFDSETGRVFKMYDDQSSREIESRLSRQGVSLLEGGSSYSNIYSGGADETHFCAVDLGWDTLWKRINFLKLGILTVLNFFPVLKSTIFLIYECMHAFSDFLKSVLLHRNNILQEWKFIFSRISTNILLRDFITFGALIDVKRGIPIIHLNFIGYDEYAHRRGPSSRFAYSALKGIDASIRKIYKEAVRSRRRNYDIWVYSDHGQCHVTPFETANRQSVADAVNSAFNKGTEIQSSHKPRESEGIQLLRSGYFSHPLLKKLSPIFSRLEFVSDNVQSLTTAMGPIGHIHTRNPLPAGQLEQIANTLAVTSGIPLVLLPVNRSQVKAVDAQGTLLLPDEAEEFWNKKIPWVSEATDDLIRLVHHPGAGAITITGWSPQGQRKPLSFPAENGAHGDLTPQATDAFVLMPSDILQPYRPKAMIRPLDIRYAAMDFLKRSNREKVPAENAPAYVTPERKDTLRVMTYNVHGCLGLDRKLSPQRIARVIAQSNPDIVMLQELDMNRKRSGGVDQPKEIAKILEMKFHFSPTISVEEGKYGNAVLSRFPISVVRAEKLPQHPKLQHLEERGVIWVSCNINGKRLHCVVTHLGLNRAERLFHTDKLLSSDWLKSVDDSESMIFAGDFNAGPSSPVIRQISSLFQDVQQNLPGHRPKATWMSRLPVRRIDYIFTSHNIQTCSTNVPRNRLERAASDHLPLVADVRL